MIIVLYQLTLRVHKEFREVPFYQVSVGIQDFKDLVSIVSDYVDLLGHRKCNSVLRYEGFNFLRCTRLLFSKLITRHGDNFKTFIR